MKRSFNCPDLFSIGDSVGVFDNDYDCYQQPSKRRRADSSSSSCLAACDCCWEEDRTSSCADSFLFLPNPSTAAMEPDFSTAAQVVSPELAPVAMSSCEEIRVAPAFPLLGGLEGSSSSVNECPATAALERFMFVPLKSDEKLASSQGDHDNDYSQFSFHEQGDSPWFKQDSNSPLPLDGKLDSALLPPPRQASGDDAKEARIVSFSSNMTSLISVTDSSCSSRTIDSITADSSLLSMLSSCTLEPTKKHFSKRSIPSSNQAGAAA